MFLADAAEADIINPSVLLAGVAARPDAMMDEESTDANPFAAPPPTSAGGLGGGSLSASLGMSAAPPPEPPTVPVSAPKAAVPGAPAAGAEPEMAASVATFHDLDISSSSNGAPPSGSGGAPGEYASQAFSAATNGAFEPAVTASGVAAASPDLAVTVSEPMKQGEGMSAYFTYEVSTKTSLPQYAHGQFSVTRRFRDFDWLHAQLALKYPGAIVPPLPEKQSVTTTTQKVTGMKQSEAFLENRRWGLQRFLHHLAAHPLLHTAADFKEFLEKDDAGFEAWKELSKQSKPPLYTTLAEGAKQSWSSAYAKGVSYLSGGGESANAHTPLTDERCVGMGNYASSLKSNLTAVHTYTKAYVERHKSMSGSIENFGDKLNQLARCEAAINQSLGEGIGHMGECMGRISGTLREQAEREEGSFEEPMAHYVRLLGAVKTAIHCRETALASLNRASASLAAKKERLEKLRASGSAKEEKLAVGAKEVADAEDAVTLAKGSYEEISHRVDVEVERFQNEKLADFRKYCTTFIKLQLEYSHRVEAAWRDLLPRLEQIDDGAAPGAPNGAGGGGGGYEQIS